MISSSYSQIYILSCEPSFSLIFSNNSCTYLLWYPTVSSKLKHLKINLSSSLWNKILFCHPCFYSWYQHSIDQASSKPSSYPGFLPAFTLHMKPIFQSSQLFIFGFVSSLHTPTATIQTWKFLLNFTGSSLSHIHNTQLPHSCWSMALMSLGLFAKAVSSF